MPRFFFNIVDGQDKPDQVGTELPDLAAVRQEALRSSGELLRDAGEEFWSGGRWTMHVLDELGQEVLTLCFSGSLNAATGGIPEAILGTS